MSTPSTFRTTILLAIAALAPARHSGAQTPNRSRVVATVDSIITLVQKERRVPGISALVAYGDTPILQKGYGVSDLDDDAPATTRTIYGLASITKQFTAALILQLVKEGKLSLDDTASKYLPDNPALLQPVTIRQLLNHTSGLRSPGALGDRYWARRDYTREEWMRAWTEVYRGKQPDFPAGSTFGYRDVNYMILAMVSEKITGRPFWDELRARYFQPLGMSSTGPCNGNVVMKGRAKGYIPSDSAPFGVLPLVYFTNTVVLGNNGLCSNVQDLFTWQRALVKHKVVDSATYAQMTTTTPLPGGQEVEYGYGLMAFPVGRDIVSFHTGGTVGFTGFLGYLPGHDATIAILANSDSDPLRIGAEVARAVAGLPPVTTASMTSEQIQRFVGTYEQNGVRAVVLPRRGQAGELEAAVTGTPSLRFAFPVRLMRQSDTTFLVGWEPETRAVFHLAGPVADQVTFSYGSRTMQLRRVETARPGEAAR